MAFKFIVYVDAKTKKEHLCEGAVYTDDRSILDTALAYPNNDFSKALVDRDTWNRYGDQSYGTYEIRDTFSARLSDINLDVLSSLEAWQKNAFAVVLTEK